MLLELGNQKLGFFNFVIVVSDLGCSGGDDCRKCRHSMRVYGGSGEGSVVGYVILVLRRLCFFVFSVFDWLEAIVDVLFCFYLCLMELITT